MRIAVDAMGSDQYPTVDIAGAVLAARQWNDEIVLVGHQTRIETELAKHSTAGLNIEIVHADEVIQMDDKPADSAKHKAASSMHIGLQLVHDGSADAFVTAGNTGAVLATAILTLKRIRNVKRPALTAIFPNIAGHVVAADIGANVDCKPEYLLQFAIMASLYTELVLGTEKPRVALLSNGEEECKGNTLVKDACALLAAETRINFVGNVEPKEVLAGATDIVIHDGFTGNVMIKSIEAAAGMVSKLIRQEIQSGPITSLGGVLAYPAFKRVAKRTDPFEIGGVPLLGVDGVVIIGHGRSNDIGIKNAIGQARIASQSGIVEAIQNALNS
jgi:glycerol-3-phosphate acyltransferase PlsX